MLDLLAFRRFRGVATAPGARRRRRWLILAGGLLTEAVPLWLRTGRLGGEVIVRCRAGHLFTTIWIPGVSLKSVRLGRWRVQRCPVGQHFSLVTPVSESELSEDQRKSASERKDIRIP